MRKCKNWLSSYLKYTEKAASPELWHLWAGISVIGGILGRGVYFDLTPLIRIYPNEYIVLVGPSGLGKSSAANPAMALFREALNGEAMIVTGKVTMQKLIKDMGDVWLATGESKAFIYASEYKCFTEAVGSGSSLLPDMTHMWDCPDSFDYRTKKEGLITVDKVCLNMLGCSTPEWLVTSGGKDFINSGFCGRNIFVYQDIERSRLHRQRKDNTDYKLRDDLIHDMREIMMIRGEFDWDEKADKIMECWYGERERFNPIDERIKPFANRKQEHVIKLSMVLSACCDDSLVVDEGQMIMAIKMMEDIEKLLPKAFFGLGYHAQDEHREIILEALQRKGKLSEKALMRRCQMKMTYREFNDVLGGLVKSGLVEASIEKKHTKTTTYYEISIDDGEDCDE